MNEENEPDWLAELTKNAKALRQQIEESSEALRGQVDQLVRSAEQFARDAQRTTPGGPVPPFQQRMVGAVGSVMRGLVPAAGYPGHPGIFRGYVRVEPTVTGTGSLALPPMRFVGDGDVATATETEAVKVVPDWPSFLVGLSAGQILAIVLIWVVAYLLPLYLYSQSPTPSTLIDADLATISFAYTITCRIVDKRK